MTQPRHRPAAGEGDINLSPLRQAWQQRHVGPAGRAMAEEDARLFLHQSVSSPCLTAIRRAEGIWIEDVDGRRAMDFHGNSVHHIGYGHKRLKAAIARQMDDLPFAPRRYTNEPTIALARKLAAIAPAGLEKVLFTSGGSDAIEVALKLARAATGRFKTVSFWDSFHGAGFAAAGLGGGRDRIAGLGEGVVREQLVGQLAQAKDGQPRRQHCAGDFVEA